MIFNISFVVSFIFYFWDILLRINLNIKYFEKDITYYVDIYSNQLGMFHKDVLHYTLHLPFENVAIENYIISKDFPFYNEIKHELIKILFVTFRHYQHFYFI